MLAEIKNKASHTMEDQLTGDFFGTIRYLPFEKGLLHVLSAVRFNDVLVQQEWLRELQKESGHTEINFWLKHEEGEIDLLLPLTNALVGIEIKYFSGISSEDGNDLEITSDTSRNQLARYARMLLDLREDNKPLFLVFLAPFQMMQAVEKSLEERNIIKQEVSLGYICWEDVLETLTAIDTTGYQPGESLILTDLIHLLKKKKLMRYRGFAKDLLQKEVSKEAFLFQKPAADTKSWHWPTKLLNGDVGYVCNN
ncbi:hypothetical protein I6J18_01905 [Peribacillus psychrosaccharolyticus]|uniref:NERD domain-containing protein n=2 Tax=Peribacillus psychrosaccharolyticus TaxID=1407 RepID=A0A974S0N3_PERPY|nr:hypothetical protein [Peribacillus psychrosaccharolyticus]MED3745533.1 hypothetical protein [Peribacillus psychrosaccharolyticus]QQT00714.1 hypothetical protein I6J18_01905 [Peribacillus psychrosaccharolyticus]